MEHNAPHPSSVFEGFYSKFDLPSGAHLTIIICSVRGAKTRPHMVSLTYIPHDVTQTFQKEIWADDIQMRKLDQQHSFELVASNVGFVRWNADSTTDYQLESEGFSFHGKATARIPWSPHTSTPESYLVRLPLPLHWHVHTLGSICDFKLDIESYNLPSPDQSGKAIVHQEKNWAHSFPSAHIWLQARDGDRGFCCAGGKILGMEAFLVGYRNKDYSIDFRPPFALRVAGLSPFMSYKSDWDSRTFEMSVQSFWHKLVVKVEAPKGTFFPLSAPFPDGHRPNFLNESFQAVMQVQVYEGGLFSPWKLVSEDKFNGASIEFGGDYYPPRGSEEKYH